jgi:hypothetical protein
MATQMLVVSMIRTAGSPFKSRPSRPLFIGVDIENFATYSAKLTNVKMKILGGVQ